MVYYLSHQSSICWSNSSMHWNEISDLLRCKAERVLEAVSGFIIPFSSSFEDNELYFLSFSVPVKPDTAKDLIEADDIGRKAVADFIDSLLVENMSFCNPIKCYNNKLTHSGVIVKLPSNKDWQKWELSNMVASTLHCLVNNLCVVLPKRR